LRKGEFAKWTIAQVFSNNTIKVRDNDTDNAPRGQDPESLPNQLLAFFSIKMLQDM